MVASISFSDLSSEIKTVLADFKLKSSNSSSPASSDLKETQIREITSLLIKWNQLKDDLHFTEKEAFLPEIKNLEILKTEIEEDLSKENIENFKKKEAICIQLEKLYGDENKKKILDELNRAKQLWKNIGKVDRLNGLSIETRFQSNCQRLFDDCRLYLEDRKKLTQESLERRHQMIDKIKKFNEMDIHFVKVNQEIKKIIADWKKEIPLTNQYLEINQQFKVALDSFYEKSEEFFEKQKTFKKESLESKKKILSKIHDLQSTTTPTDKSVRKKILQLYQEWTREKNFHGKDHQQIQKLFASVMEKLLESIGENLDSRKQARQAVIDELEKIRIKFSDSKTFEIAEHVLKLKQEWQRCLPILAEDSKIFEISYQKKLDLIVERIPSFNELVSQIRKKNLEQKRSLLEKAEKLFSAEEKNSEGKKCDHQEVVSLTKEWDSVGEIPRKYFFEIEQAFKKKMDVYFDRFRKQNKIRRKQLQNNFEKKKNLIDRLEILKSKFDKKNVSDKITPEKLKIVLEMNRQFAHANQDKKTEQWNMIKMIQKEWKDITLEETNQDYGLHKKYKSLCHEVFFLLKQKK